MSFMVIPNRILLVIGLPGSGKSTLLGKFPHKEVHVIDDIVSLTQLPAKFPEGKMLCISSPTLCIYWKSAVNVLEETYPGIPIGIICFENNLKAAMKNMKQRNDYRVISEHYVKFLSDNYQIPDYVEEVLPIFDVDTIVQ